MTKLKRQKIERRPSHPGEILKSIWLDELGLSQLKFAKMLSEASTDNVKPSTMQTKLSEVINGKRSMSADFSVLVSKVLKTSPRMWMNLQVNLDIWEAEKKAA